MKRAIVALLILSGLLLTWSTIRAQPVVRLTDGVLSPASGLPGGFTFSVTYWHEDGTRPVAPGVQVAVVDVDSGAPAPGSPFTLATTDEEGTDGTRYTATVTLPAGRYRHTFTASDGAEVATLGPNEGPFVNTPPVLSAASVSPATGDATTYFRFAVTYQDGDDQPPLLVEVVVDDQPYTLTRSDTTSFAVGSVYRIDLPLPPGLHRHYFRASDRLGMVAVFPSEAPLEGPANGARFTGTVTLADSGEPVANASVYSSTASVRTDAQGRYEVFGPAGTYDLCVEPPAGQNLLGQQFPVTVAVGDQVTHNFALAAGGTLTGIVTAEGEPLPGAMVNVSSLEGFFFASQTTDATGRYTVERLPSGQVLLAVYPPEGRNLVPESQVVTTIQGATVTRDVALPPGAVLQLQVTDPASAPLAGAEVVVTGTEVYRAATTDAAGQATIDRLVAGTYRVSVSPPGNRPELRAQELNVTLAAGQTLPCAFTLAAGGILRVVVRDEAGEPLEGVRVTASALGGGLFLERSTGADGGYSFQLSPGTYRLEASGPTTLLPAAHAGVVVTENSTTTVDLQLRQGGVLRGVVTDHAGAPVERAYVTLWLDNWDYRGVYTDSDGAYLLEGIPEGHWRLDVDPPSESSSLGCWHDFVTLTAGQTTRRDVVLPLGSFIRVTVTDATGPVGGARVFVFPGGYPIWTTDDGVATIGPLEPGTYRVEVSAGETGGLLPQRHSGIVVAAGQTVEVAVRLQPSGSLTGTIRDVNGQPVAGASVTLNGPAYVNTHTGADGTYHFASLAPGRYEIRVNPPSDAALLTNYATFFLSAGEEATRDLVLPPSGVLEGRVLDPAGAPVAGATLYLSAVDQGLHTMTTSGSDGRYRLVGITDGIYDLTAEPPAGLRAVAATASGLAIRPGPPVERDLQLGPAGSLSGIIRGPDERPVAALVTVRYTLHYAERSEQVSTGSNGRYTFAQLPPGMVTLEVEGPASTLQQTIPGIPISAGAETTRDVTLAAAPGPATVRAVVTLDGVPVSGAVVILYRDDVSVASSSTNDSGTALLSGLSAGHYRLEVWPYGEPTALDAEVGGIVVAEGETVVVPVALVAGGTVTGTVRDSLGRRVSEGWVYLRAAASSWSEGFTYLQSDGSFRVVGVRPGVYDLVVTPSDSSGVAGKRVSGIAVSAGQTTHTDLVLGQGATLRGVVRDARGMAQANVSVCLESPDFQTTVMTDRDGTYVCTFVAPDTYRVWAEPWYSSNLLASEPQSVSLAEGATVEHDIVVPLAGALAGRVVDSREAGIPNVQVALSSATDWATILTDDQGYYRFEGLRAPQVSVTFTAPDRLNLIPVRLANVALTGTPVTQLDVMLREGATLTGVVTYRGMPLPEASISLDGPTDGSPQVKTDAEGRYTLNRLSPGVHWLVITPPSERAPEAAFQQFWVEVGQPGTTLVRDVALPEEGVITGQVFDAAGKALSDALIQVEDEHGRWRDSQSLDSDGRFRFGHLPTGRYRLAVFPSQSMDRNLLPLTHADVAVTAGAVTHLTLTATEGVRLAGRVTDTTGQPVFGASVTVYSAWQHQARATTDAEGAYVLSGLPTGTYRIVVDPPPGRSLAAQSANNVLLHSGTTTRDFVLPPPATLTVRVVDGAGNPVASARATLTSADLNAPSSRDRMSNLDGVIQFISLPGGLYDLLVEPPAVASTPLLPQRRSGIRVAPGASVTLEPLVLEASGSLAGRVETPDGAGVPGVRVIARGHDAEREAFTDSDGSYQIDGLPPGSCWVEAQPDPATGWIGSSVAGVVVASGSVAHQNLRLLPGGRLSGQVTDGTAAVASARIVARGLTGLPHSTYSGADGRFTLVGLPPGTYTLEVTPSAASGLLPTSIAGISLTAGGEATRSVVLARGGALTGVVRGPGGRPVPYPSVMLYQHGQPLTSVEGNWDGNFTVSGLRAGLYEVVVVGQGEGAPELRNGHGGDKTAVPGPAVLPNVAITLGQTTPLEVTLSAGGVLAVTVQDASGNPVEGAHVGLEYTEPALFAGAVGGAVTDSNGQAWLRMVELPSMDYWPMGLPTGACNLRIEPPPYRNLMAQRVDGIGIAAGQETPRTVTLGQGAELRGRITDAAGTGLGHLTVQVWGTSRSSDGQSASAQTDSTGAYRFESLVPGTYTLSVSPDASHRGFLPKSVSGLAVSAGTPLVRDLVLERGAVVTGVVIDARGAPLAEAVVRLTSLAPNATDFDGETETDAAGRYLISPVPPGEYEITAQAPPYHNLAVYKARLTLTSGQELTQNLQLAAGAVIEGLIQDEEGNPVAGVLVYTLGHADHTSSSDSSGRYRLEQLSAGTYDLHVEPTDDMRYLAQALTGVTVAAGETVTRNLVLRRAGEIRGRITTADGQPVAGASIDVGIQTWQTVQSDSNGAYHVAGVPPGPRTVKVVPPAGSGLLPATREGVPVIARQTAVADFTLAAAATLTGVALDTRGVGVAGAIVSALRSERGAPAITAPVDSAGYYRLDLPPDRYDVTVQPAAAQAGLLLPATHHNVVLGAGETRVLDFTLADGGAIEGRVLDSDGQPLPGFVTVQGVAPDAYGAPQFGAFTREVPLGEDGRYHVPGIPSGNFTVTPTIVTPVPPVPQRAQVTVAAGQTVEQNFTLAAGGVLEGRVSDPEGTAVMASVAVGRPGQPPSEWRETTTDAGGRYRVAGLAPAEDYQLRVTPLAGSLQPAERTVAVVAGETTQADIDLVVGGVLEGRVSVGGTQPAPGARVLLSGPAQREGETDSYGYYRFAGLPPGTYALSVDPAVETAAVGQVVDEIPITAGAVVTRDVSLAAAGRITGIVTDSAGQPVAGVSVMIYGAGRPTEWYSFYGGRQERALATGGDGSDAGHRARLRARLSGDGHSYWGAVTTGADGRFTFSSLPTGHFRLVTDAPAMGDLGPGAVDVDVTVGQEATATVVLPPGARVSGQVLGATGAPLTGVTVQLSGPLTYATTATDAEGRFSFARLGPGTHDLEVLAPYGEGSGSRRVTLEVPEGGTVVQDVLLQSTGTITGVVTGPEGPLANARVRISGHYYDDSRATGPDGSYRFEHLAPGVYSLEVTGPRDAGLNGATADLNLAPLQTLRHDFTLPVATGSVSGRVHFTGTQTGPILVGLFEALPTYAEETGIGHYSAAGRGRNSRTRGWAAITEAVAGTEGPLAQTTITAAGPFTLSRVPDGQYHLLAVLDQNGNGQVDPGEPTGKHGQPNAVFVTGGAAVTGVDITLRLPFAAPQLAAGHAAPRQVAPGASVRLRVQATGAQSVAAEVRDAETGASLGTIPLLDDGTHGDGAAADGLYGGTFVVPAGAPRDCTVDFIAADEQGNRVIAAAAAGFATAPFTPGAEVLFLSANADRHLLQVDQQGNTETGLAMAPAERLSVERYYTDALRVAGRRFDVWRTVCRGPVDPATLMAYAGANQAVVIAWPYAEASDAVFTAREAIVQFLEAGGRLFLSGQDFGWSAEGNDGSRFDVLFRQYLHAGLVSDYGSFELEGRPADPLTDGLRFRVSGGDGANNQESPDAIVALPPAQPLLFYLSSPAAHTRAASRLPGAARVSFPVAPRRLGRAFSENGDEPLCGGLRVDTGRYKVVYLAFGLEAVADAGQRAGLLARSLDFLLEPVSPAGQITATADPAALPADGTAESLLTATLTTATGAPVPDGTLVSFRGHNASVPASARTAGGKVSVPVRAGERVGAMAVAITSGAASTTVTINGVAPAPAVRSTHSRSRTSVEVVFDRPMDPATAANPANYAFSPALGVTAAALAEDPSRVILTTDNQLEVLYTLTVSGVLDATGRPLGVLNRASFLGTGPALTVAVSASPARIIADGTDAAHLTITVTDADGRPAADGTTVQLSTSLGTLAATSLTTTGGSATTTLTASTTGTAVVTAQVGQAKATASVEVLAAGPASITLEALPAQVPATGTHTASLKATVVDALGRPLNGVPVTFETDLGTVAPATANTSEGVATAALRGTTVGTATVTASADGLSATTTVVFTAPTEVHSVTVTAQPTTLPADGTSTATVVITVRDASGKEVTTPTAVELSASTGSIPATATTTNGQVEVVYRAGTTPGTATITAMAGGVTGQVEITLVSPTAPARVTVVVEPATLPADGISTAAVTVEVLTVGGTPVPDGTKVQLSASGGTIAASGTTTGGRFTTTYTAGTTPGTVLVAATAGEVTGTAELTLTAGTTVQGTVILPAGVSLPPGTVAELRDAADHTLASTPVAPDGHFRLTAENPGVFDVVLLAPGYVPLRQREVDLTRDGRAVRQEVRFPLIAQPALGEAFGMITLPFSFRQGAIEQVLGDPDAVLYAYDPKAKRYHTAGIDPFPEVAPGRGFWLKPRRGGDRYRIETPADVPAADQPVSVPLAPGWQIIGNPFPTHDLDLSSVKVLLPGAAAPVPLGDPTTTNKVRGYLWGWDGSAYQLVAATAEGTTTTLRAYEGYWIRSLVEGARLVFEPASRAPASPTAGRQVKAEGWRARIEARAGDQRAIATFGVGRSAYTIDGPPPLPGQVTVRFLTPGAERAAVDVRAKTAEGPIWRFEVVTDRPGETVTLSWPDLGGVPRDTRLVLVDEQSGQRRQMRTSASVSFRAGDTPRRYRIEAEPAAAAPLAISGLGMLPVRGGGRSITYTLSAGGTVSVTITSPTGRVLRRVAVGEVADRGRNQLYWDGRDERGVVVPAGLVLLQVTATNDEGAAVRASRPVVLTR